MGKTREVMLDLAVVVVVICTVTVTAILIQREYFARPHRTRRPDPKPELLENWRDLAAVGHRTAGRRGHGGRVQ